MYTDRVAAVEEYIPEDQQFTIAVARGDSGIINSSLYLFVQDLRKYESNSELMRELTITDLPHLTRKAHIITLNDAPKHSLFTEKGFQYLGSHLTIDEKYYRDASVKSFHGYSLAHYTAEYIKGTGQEKQTLIVHVYFNSCGQYLYCQKKTTDSKQTNWQYEIVSFKEELHIKDNSQFAREILQTLLKEKSQRYINNFNLSLTYVQKFSTAITQKDLQTYRELVENFKKIIALLNRYNDNWSDKRDVFAQRYLDSLQLSKEAEYTKPEEQPEELLSQDDDEDLIETAIVVKGKQRDRCDIAQKNQKSVAKIAVLFQKLQKKYAELLSINKQHDNDITSIIHKYELSQEIKLLIFEIECFSTNQEVINEDAQSLIKKIEQQRGEYAKYSNDTCLIELFKKECLAGRDIVAVKSLFPYVVNYIPPAFYMEFLIKAVDHDNENKIVEIGNFLFENSQVYRDGVLFEDPKKLYDLNIILQIDDIGYGLLFFAFLKKKFALFNMLCQQGGKHSSPGIIYKDRAISLAKALIRFYTPEHNTNSVHESLELLIKRGLDLEKGDGVMQSFSIKQYKGKTRLGSPIPLEQLFGCYDKKKQPYYELFDPLLNTKSCLEMVCSGDIVPLGTIELQTIKLLAINSTVRSIVMSIAQLSNLSSVSSAWVQTEMFNLFTVNTSSKAKQLAKCVVKQGADCLSLILKPMPDGNDLDLKEGCEACTIINELLLILGEKMEDVNVCTYMEDLMSIECFKQSEEHYKKSLSTLVNEQKKLYLLDASLYTRSCIILLMLSNKNSVAKAKSLICFFKRLGDIALEYGKDKFIYQAYYDKLVYLAEHAKYELTEKLQKLYEDTKRKLDAMVTVTVAPQLLFSSTKDKEGKNRQFSSHDRAVPCDKKKVLP